VLRGGSWINNGRNVRSANRNRNEPAERNDNNGLRLARAHGFAGWQMSDQTIILSAYFFNRRGKKQKEPGM
jgi:alpha-mannosidase